MTLGDQAPIVTASGSVVAFAGAAVAGTSSADVGNAAIIVAMGGLVTGILGGITQLVKLILDSKNYSARIRQLEADLQGSRDRRHAEAGRFDGMLKEQQYKQIVAEKRAASAEKKANESAIRVARLEGQLGMTDKAHSQAINANSENIVALGEKTGTELPSPTPHVEPIVPETDDEIAPFPGRFPDNHGPRPGP